MFTCVVTEASNVLNSVTSEVDRAILSSLEYRPPTSVCDLVTVHVKWLAIVRQDAIHTGHVAALVQGIQAVTGVVIGVFYREEKKQVHRDFIAVISWFCQMNNTLNFSPCIKLSESAECMVLFEHTSAFLSAFAFFFQCDSTPSCLYASYSPSINPMQSYLPFLR